MYSPPSKPTLEGERKDAESLVEVHEESNLSARFQPPWLGEEGFEDLTERWLAACDKTPQEKASSASSRYSSEPSLTQSESASEKEDSYQQESCTPSPIVSKNEDCEVRELQKLRALRGIQSSINGKSNAFQKIHYDVRILHKILGQLKSNIHADEGVGVSEEALREEAGATFAEVMRQKKKKKILEAFKLYLLAALESYLKEAPSARSGELIKALEKIVSLEKGKEALKLERPSLDLGTWKDFMDWIIWEVEEYCWIVGYEDAEVDAQLLVCVKRMKEMLEHH